MYISDYQDDSCLFRLFFHKEKRAMEKLKCIINYFRRITVKGIVLNSYL